MACSGVIFTFTFTFYPYYRGGGVPEKLSTVLVSALQVANSAAVFRYRQLMHVKYGRYLLSENGSKLAQ